MSDEWAAIEGFPSYGVNRLGQVCNFSTGRILRLQQNQYGVVFVGMLDADGWQKQRSVVRMVAHAFLPQDLEAFDTPIQIDGDRWNCEVGNLAWRPRWFAIRYHQQFKRRYPFSIQAPIRDIGSGDIYRDSWVVVRTFGLLEEDLVVSIELRTYVWPTYQIFERA